MYRVLYLLACLFMLVTGVPAQMRSTVVEDKPVKDTSPVDFNQRIALVIGNAAYSKNVLNNPVNDALDIAQKLKQYGFYVISDTNVDRRTFNRLINEFGERMAGKKGVSCFYYAGHGLQYQSQNYVLPTDAVIKQEPDITDEAIRVNKVYEKMRDANNGLNFVVLDACRNTPYHTSFSDLSRGLTDAEKTPPNTVVFYSTRPGEFASDGTGRNSPFTESLVQVINEDSIELFQVIKKVTRLVKQKTDPVQLPSLAGTLPDQDFYFKLNKEKGKGKLYLLSIGISRYQQLPSLKYAGKDARDIVEAFKKQEEIFHKEAKSWLLTDGAATKYNILKGIKDIKGQVTPDDMILVFFSGHNLKSGYDGQSYFLPYDANISDSTNNSSLIQYEEIRSLLADSYAKSVLLLDGVYDGNTAAELAKTENGVVVMASASAGGNSYESDAVNNGFFAAALVEGLSGAADLNKDGLIDIQSLYDYVNERVGRLAKEVGGFAQPALFAPKAMRNFILSKAIPGYKRRDLETILKVGDNIR